MCTLACSPASQLLSESWSGGPLDGLSVTNGYDQYLRRTNLALKSQISNLAWTAYSYDNASRLQTVSAGPYNATYSYLANSPLVSQITFRSNSVTRMTTTKQYDFLNRLTQVSSAPSAPPAPPAPSTVSFSYTYNTANQRVRSTLADGSYWLYAYDALGQVTSGKKYWRDGTPVAGQQFEYGFDDIGNRTSAKAGGDQNGAGLRSANYSANILNQYTSRDVPGAVDIMGLAFATNTVTVNGQTAYRKGEYFRKELLVTNSSAPLWTNITVAATGQSNVSGYVFVPKSQEQLSYDGDGNLTNDGRWTYTWDAENRLLSLTARTNIGLPQLVKFEYDAKGRRIHKQVWNTTDTNTTPALDLSFVYDGWNPLAELDTSHSALRTYTWGLDLSGSLQGAGGVGGLLAVSEISDGQISNSHFAAYDGNGNLAALVNAAGGSISAQYEYGPFGELLRATGPTAKANPFRFSTKYHDDETDLLHYGYRYYSASTGRWLSRDPIEETGGKNLYAFVKNGPLYRLDYYGLAGLNYEYPEVVESLDVAAGSRGWEHTWLGAEYLENQPQYRLPSGALTYAYTVGKHVRGTRWEDCPCGWKLAYYSLRTRETVYFSGTTSEAGQVVYRSGRSALHHETAHVFIDRAYDDWDLEAYAPVFDKCISRRCYSAWYAYRTATVQAGKLLTSLKNLQLEVEDYSDGASRDYYQERFLEQGARLLPVLMERISTAFRMAYDCSGLPR